MNAAARLVHQNHLSRYLVMMPELTRRQLGMLALTLAILFSALSIIYVTHMNRIFHAMHQRELIERDQLQIELSQLLLERGTWMRAARTQEVAEKSLDMIVPDYSSIVMIHE